ncbi:MAG: hypothetical protein LBS09_07195 [Bacteroidales bacterium]|jgi:hypothetical protein|nr:hypothetical protein [Bacteroidales bacterium]
MIIIEDIIGEAVRATGERLDRPVHYMYGHLRSILQTLSSYDRTAEFAKQKYPLIALLCDFVEYVQSDKQYERWADLHLLIVADSNRDYREEERLEKVYKPILIPIYEAFMDELKNNTNYVSEVTNSIYGYAGEEFIKRYALSNALNESVKQQGLKSLFNDHLDGIEIRNLRLEFISHC